MFSTFTVCRFPLFIAFPPFPPRPPLPPVEFAVADPPLADALDVLGPELDVEVELLLPLLTAELLLVLTLRFELVGTSLLLLVFLLVFAFLLVFLLELLILFEFLLLFCALFTLFALFVLVLTTDTSPEPGFPGGMGLPGLFPGVVEPPPPQNAPFPRSHEAPRPLLAVSTGEKPPPLWS